MTIERKHIWIQTLAIVLPILAGFLVFALAQEHRQTVTEEATRDNTQQIRMLVRNQTAILENQAKLTTLMEMTLKRHELEDTKRK